MSVCESAVGLLVAIRAPRGRWSRGTRADGRRQPSTGPHRADISSITTKSVQGDRRQQSRRRIAPESSWRCQPAARRFRAFPRYIHAAPLFSRHIHCNRVANGEGEDVGRVDGVDSRVQSRKRASESNEATAAPSARAPRTDRQVRLVVRHLGCFRRNKLFQRGRGTGSGGRQIAAHAGGGRMGHPRERDLLGPSGCPALGRRRAPPNVHHTRTQGQLDFHYTK